MGLSPDQLKMLLHDWGDMIRQSAVGLRRLSAIQEAELLIGTTPKTTVYQEDKVTLYRYTPVVEHPFHIPLLIVYSLVNRPTLLDLHESRSLVRSLINQGIDVYLIDWGYPSRSDRWLTLDDYINGTIDTCQDVIARRCGLRAFNMLGVCQGGVFALCYAALHPEKVKNLVTMVTPVDFHAGTSVISGWAGHGDLASSVDVAAVVAAYGNIPGSVLNMGFLMREPFALNVSKYLGLLDLFNDEVRLLNFLRVEKWSFDSPDLAGEAFRQFVQDCYQQNKLIRGSLEIGGQRVDLKRVTMPVLNLHAQHDDIIPPPAAEALGAVVGTDDYTIHDFPVGHIGMYISSKVQSVLPSLIADWLKARGL